MVTIFLINVSYYCVDVLLFCYSVMQISDMEKNWEKDTSAVDIPPSFDSEGLFPLDGMEEKTILEEDDHSEEDLSDTDGNNFVIIIKHLITVLKLF